MEYPNFKGKHAEDSLFEPQEYLDYVKKKGKYPSFPAPKGILLCYQRSLLSHIKRHHAVETCDGIFSSLLFLKETDRQVAVIGGFGIGSPVASVIVEELIAFGVKKFISVGTAGTLQKDLHIGDLVVCDRAIRDEGTSHHYLPPGKYAYPSKRLTENLTTSFRQQGQEFRVGTSWTIDAPYRETVTEARHYQEDGVATVEMEAAALFAVAEYRQVDMAAVFSVSDSLADLKWHPDFHNKKVQGGLEVIYKAAVAALSAN